MAKKILVTYGTKNGSTGEMAQFIGKELADRGAEVDVREHAQAGPIRSYSAMVWGSPIISNECLPASLFYLQRNRSHLAHIPVALFFTCMIITRTDQKHPYPDTPIFLDSSLKNSKLKEKTHSLAHYLTPVVQEAPQIDPIDIAFFKGKLDLNKTDFFGRMLMTMIMMMTNEVREGDFRNWDAMADWVDRIYPLLTK